MLFSVFPLFLEGRVFWSLGVWSGESDHRGRWWVCAGLN